MMDIEMLEKILATLMEINVKGNDAIALSQCMMSLQDVIVRAKSTPAPMPQSIDQDAE